MLNGQRFKTQVRFIVNSWACWVSLVAIGVVWGLPRIPYYQNWMPFGYELGGIALVMMYLSFGFLSLGLYGLVMGGLSWRSDPLRSRRTFNIGLASLGLVTGLGWCYLKLMNLTLSL